MYGTGWCQFLKRARLVEEAGEPTGFEVVCRATGARLRDAACGKCFGTLDLGIDPRLDVPERLTCLAYLYGLGIEARREERRKRQQGPKAAKESATE